MEQDVVEACQQYADLLVKHPELNDTEKGLARAVLGASSLSMAVFVTEAPMHEVLRVYALLNESGATVTPSRKQKNPQKRKETIQYSAEQFLQHNQKSSLIRVRYNTIEMLVDNRQVSIQVSASRNYADKPNQVCAGWHTEGETEVSNATHHLYLVQCQDSYKGVLFTTAELQQFIAKDEKRISNHMIHYYFRWMTDGSVIDCRAEQPIDVAEYDVDKLSWKVK